jgi:hypothetical protein
MDLFVDAATTVAVISLQLYCRIIVFAEFEGSLRVRCLIQIVIPTFALKIRTLKKMREERRGSTKIRTRSKGIRRKGEIQKEKKMVWRKNKVEHWKGRIEESGSGGRGRKEY